MHVPEENSLEPWELAHELICNRLQVLDDVIGPLDHPQARIWQIMLCAQALGELRDARQAVARARWEEVVLHLIGQPAREPAHKGCGGDVPRRSHLVLEEAELLRIPRLPNHRLHPVVAEPKDRGEHQPARTL